MKGICLYQREISIDDIYTACARVENKIQYLAFLQRAREITDGPNRPEHTFVFWDISYTQEEWKVVEALVNIPDTAKFIKEA